MARHIILENGNIVNIDSLLTIYCENGQHYMMISGGDEALSISEKDFQAIIDAIKKEERPGKELTAEVSRLSLAIRNLYELLRARLR